MAEDRKEQDELRQTKDDPKCQKKAADFVAPDGGWGWMIVLATGFSNFCILAVVQCFGLLFMDKFKQVGITSSQITTLTSSNCATTAFLGLANGPLFRKFSSRKIAVAGGILCAFSAVMLSFAKTFTEFMAFFAILYGAGMGFSLSATSLALNTYFKEKRRVAIGLSSAVAAMGPIIMPQIITLLMPTFGQEGTVLLFGGLMFHAVACALLLQPVSWHTAKRTITDKETTEVDKKEEEEKKNSFPDKETFSKSMENIRHRAPSILTECRQSRTFGSQYLYYEDDDGAAGVDVLEASTPMMAKANDGWSAKISSSTLSLKMNGYNNSHHRHSLQNVHHKLSMQNLHLNGHIRNDKSSEFKPEPLENSTLLEPDEKKFLEEKSNGKVINYATKKNNVKERMKQVSRNIVEIFDLNLLRDPVYVNMMLGVNLANFVELNFALLTPFILGNYGFPKRQIATWMSVLAGMDLFTRLSIPFVSSYIGWSNRTFFLIGVCSMAAGRILLAHVRNYVVLLVVAALVGAGKAFRTIFIALVIPGYVPLDRLPAALGLQLVTSGIIFFVVGPLIGWIQDTSKDYAVTLHCLNILTYTVAVSWIAEFLYFRCRKVRNDEEIIKA